MSKAESKVVTRPWWRKKRTWLIGLMSILAAASLWMRSYNEAERDGPVLTQIGDYKSTEDMGLFPISLLIALRKFQTYEDCIEPQQGGGSRPKWGAMTSEAQVMVCVFRIADRQGSLEATRSYFRELGLRASRFDDSPTNSRLDVNCPFAPNPCPLPQLNAPGVLFFLRARYGFTIKYKDMNLIGIEVEFEIL